MDGTNAGAADDARRSLQDVVDVQRRLRDAFFYGRSGPFLIVWGVVWLVGYVVTYAWPGYGVPVWLGANGLGWAATFALALQWRGQATEAVAKALRYMLCAAVLTAYAWLWAWILAGGLPDAAIAYPGTVTGFAYTIAGLWRGPLLVPLGLAVTLLFLVGLAGPFAWFPLYAGLIGGGGLIAAGLMLARRDPA